MLKNKQDSLFFITLVIIQLIYFFTTLFYHNYNPFLKESFFIPDTYQYIMQAKNIVDDGIFYSANLKQDIDLNYYSLRPPIYSLFLAIFYIIKAPLFVILIAQNIISLFSVLIVRNTLLKFNYNKKFDLLFIILLIFTPSHFIYANTLLTEVVFQFFLVLIFRFALIYFKTKERKYILYYITFLILSAYTKPVMYLFVVPSFIYFAYISVKIKKWYPLLINIVPIIAILFIYQWNFKRTGYFHYSSIQTINLVNYNTHLFLLNKKGETYADNIIDDIHKKSKKIDNYKEKMLFLNSSATSILKNNFVDYTLFHLKGSFYMLFDPGRYDLTTFFNINTKYNSKQGVLYNLNKNGFKGVVKFLLKKYQISFLLIMSLIIVFNIIKLLSLSFFFSNKRIDNNLKFISFFIIGYIVILAGPVGASRYLMPLSPIIIGIILIDNYFIKIISKKRILWKRQ